MPSVPWQRCQCHLQRNAQAYVPKASMRETVAVALRQIFTASDRAEDQCNEYSANDERGLLCFFHMFLRPSGRLFLVRRTI
jgi:transposase-like protein